MYYQMIFHNGANNTHMEKDSLFNNDNGQTRYPIQKMEIVPHTKLKFKMN